MLHNIHGQWLPFCPQCPTHLFSICSKEWCLHSETPRSEASSWYVFNHFQMYPFRGGSRSGEETRMRISYLFGRAVPTNVSAKILGIPPGICGITCPFCTSPEVESKNSSLTLICSACWYLIKGVNLIDFGRSWSSGGRVMGWTSPSLFWNSIKRTS